MIAICPPSISFSEEDTAKQTTANKQMSDLLHRVANGQLHRTLTIADRKLLENEGYAPDLVNNLVYITQRSKGGALSEFTDKLVSGFTDAAIDPSIYASEMITHTLKVNNQGKCAFCESNLSATDAGLIFHFRPVSILEESNITRRSPYSNLAYDVNNLHYACRACCETHKQSQFPVSGKRFPGVAITEEESLLLNPYTDKPEDHIGFSPLTGQAYPLDVLQDFFSSTQKMLKTEVKAYLLSFPEQIPEVAVNTQDSATPQNELQQQFDLWVKQADLSLYRGYQTIQLFGLNRHELLYQRFTLLKTLFQQFQSGEIAFSSIEYQGACRDAIACWKENIKKTKEEQQDWHVVYSQNLYAPCRKSAKDTIPNWLKSRLIYFVRESELTVSGKRRIIYLGADDLIYGSDIPEKSVFLSIDWQAEKSNRLKVRNKKLTWETSFTELANSHPLEISKLFASNEIWAEGDYQALA